ncbi:ribose-phosphate diphosphokinase [Rickettsiales endosymbiont of Peranema trichophorum]|uniref:ribose-phosphate diphosphokinase n=1 Tax=Rickettsiales endosymbiont of Peranema trichophorum TaxID=2486577 RepID=UPI00102320A9|nr:ribose-phosphate diphosphokinase [Rickettsiales endosymbiont of Peranema trichophorum]RZI47415.1 ribose-phosphate diphosphokinase [Rickettsiales endosymbiont of Peranema trichophorum]
MKIVACSNGTQLASSIAARTHIPMLEPTIRKFSDNEVFIEIAEELAGDDIFVVQSTSYPVNDNILELAIMLDTLKRIGVKNIVPIIPYLGYGRQDGHGEARSQSIAAKLIANILSLSGANGLITLELHSKQTVGFFDIPIQHLSTSFLFSSDIREKYDLSKVAIVSPDVGGVARARTIATALNVPLIVVDKKRKVEQIVGTTRIVGDMSKMNCIIIDDIVDSGQTLCYVADVAVRNGAASVSAYVTHGVLSELAIERIRNSVLCRLVITDSIPCGHKDKKLDKTTTLTVVDLLAAAVLSYKMSR